MTNTLDEFADAFDLFSCDADLGHAYWNLGNWAHFAPTGGRFGNANLFFYSPWARAIRTLPRPLAGGPMIFGAAFCLVSLGATNLIMPLDSNGNAQCSVQTDGVGRLCVYRGDGDALLATSTAPLSTGWHTIQFKVTIDSSAGAFEVVVDGAATSSIVGTGNTQKQASNLCSAVCFGGNSNCVSMFSDPFGASGTGFKSDWKNIVLSNNADLATGWTRSGGSSNYSQVQAPQDDLTSTVHSDGPATDRYGVAPPAVLPATVFSVSLVLGHTKDLPGPCVIHGILTSNGTDAVTPDLNPPTPGFQIDQIVFNTDPATGVAWTTPALASLALGIVRTA